MLAIGNDVGTADDNKSSLSASVPIYVDPCVSRINGLIPTELHVRTADANNYACLHLSAA